MLKRQGCTWLAVPLITGKVRTDALLNSNLLIHGAADALDSPSDSSSCKATLRSYRRNPNGIQAFCMKVSCCHLVEEQAEAKHEISSELPSPTCAVLARQRKSKGIGAILWAGTLGLTC